MNMTGNTILVTGGGSGIGKALAEELHKLGNSVIITGRRQEALDAVTSANPGMEAVVLDLTDAAAIKAFAASISRSISRSNDAPAPIPASNHTSSFSAASASRIAVQRSRSLRE